MGVDGKSTLTEDQWKALKEPFKPEQIGKLPKGGVMLDFVGHAVVTSRLNGIDPDWSWRPMGVDDAGNPALDAEKNLWIWITIGGKTLPAVGDGRNMKERIGDAIRNGAMRFGVALDLWAKQELETFSEVKPPPSQPTSLKDHLKEDTKATGGSVTNVTNVYNADPVAATKAERDAVVAQARYYGYATAADKGSVTAVLSRIAGRTISGTADKSITSTEAAEMAARFIEVADQLAGEAIQNGAGGLAEA